MLARFIPDPWVGSIDIFRLESCLGIQASDMTCGGVAQIKMIDGQKKRRFAIYVGGGLCVLTKEELLATSRSIAQPRLRDKAQGLRIILTYLLAIVPRTPLCYNKT